MSNLTIRFVTDYVCPYCIAAKIPLMRAAKKRGIPIEWMPFELTTTDKPAVDTWNDPVRREKWAATLVPVSYTHLTYHNCCSWMVSYDFSIITQTVCCFFGKYI